MMGSSMNNVQFEIVTEQIVLNPHTRKFQLITKLYPEVPSAILIGVAATGSLYLPAEITAANGRGNA